MTVGYRANAGWLEDKAITADYITRKKKRRRKGLKTECVCVCVCMGSIHRLHMLLAVGRKKRRS